MAAEKAPAFQFYPKDFLMDGNVSGMSLQERGAYITLLCICWLEGSLPADVGRLANIVGTPRKAFAKFWPAISVCFQEQGDRLLHGRLELERQKQAEFRQRQSENGGKGGRPLKPTRNPRLTQTESQTEPKAKPDESSPSPISDLPSSSPKEYLHLEPVDEAFERFKAAYPASRRQGGHMATQLFVAAASRVGPPALLAALEQHKRSKQWQIDKVIPNMLTWLEDEHWTRELPAPSAFGSSAKTAGNADAARQFMERHR